MHMQIHDFVAIHLVVITADNLNECIHLLYFCSFMLREYKDGLRKAILNLQFAAKLPCTVTLFIAVHGNKQL